MMTIVPTDEEIANEAAAILAEALKGRVRLPQHPAPDVKRYGRLDSLRAIRTNPFCLSSRYLYGHGPEGRRKEFLGPIKELADLIAGQFTEAIFSRMELPQGAHGESGDVVIRFLRAYDIHKDQMLGMFDCLVIAPSSTTLSPPS